MEKPLQQRLCVLFTLTSLCLGCAGVEQKSPEVNPDPLNSATLTLANGSTRIIAVEQMDYSGQATLTLADGSSRSGTWLNGKLDGMGMEETASAVYTGQWHNDLRHGHGELKHRNGSSYVGNFAEGQPHGRGIFTSKQGVYRGTWANGKRHGEGQFNDSNGDVYQGQWTNDMRQGIGVAQYSSGAVYSGDWAEDQPNGFGQKTYASGAAFEGSWIAGQRQGYGVWIDVNQVQYEGTWQDDQRYGFGKETRPDGSRYEGAWLDDSKHGKGVAYFSNGSRHQGQWVHGQVFGEGRRSSRSGIVLGGFWQNNRLTTGQLLLPDGPTYNGPLFEPDGIRVAPPLLAWLKDQAAMDQPHAQYFLGSVLMDIDTSDTDLQSAQLWLEQAAIAGIEEAQYRLAEVLMDQDRAQAVKWLEAAAAQDHPGAHATLGEMFHEGVHFARDLNVALYHYSTAHQLGSLAATNHLAWLLATTADGDKADPRRAVTLITPLVLYLGHWQYLDTLAAAHAREGNFSLAVGLQQQAIIQAREEASAEQTNSMQERLGLYQADLPFIERSGSS